MITLLFYVLGITNIWLFILIVVDIATLTEQSKNDSYWVRFNNLLRRKQ